MSGRCPRCLSDVRVEEIYCPSCGSLAVVDNYSIVGQSVWDNAWATREYDYAEENIMFKDIFARYLRPGGTCFEVGCYPGNFLTYLGKRFGYTVSGIDRTPDFSRKILKKLANNAVAAGEFFEGDFFEFETEERYDLVCSFGFLEHFSNTEFVIERHARLVKPGGTLLIESPNFRKIQFLLHYLLDRQNLEIHNIKAMDLERWNRTLRHNSMIVEYQGFWGTMSFWTGVSKEGNPLRDIAAYLLGQIMNSLDSRFNHPSSCLSPFMISVSRKGSVTRSAKENSEGPKGDSDSERMKA